MTWTHKMVYLVKDHILQQFRVSKINLKIIRLTHSMRYKQSKIRLLHILYKRLSRCRKRPFTTRTRVPVKVKTQRFKPPNLRPSLRCRWCCQLHSRSQTFNHVIELGSKTPIQARNLSKMHQSIHLFCLKNWLKTPVTSQ